MLSYICFAPLSIEFTMNLVINFRAFLFGPKQKSIIQLIRNKLKMSINN